MKLLRFIFAIIFTPIALIGWMIAYPIVCAWNIDQVKSDKWADNYWHKWGLILKP